MQLKSVFFYIIVIFITLLFTACSNLASNNEELNLINTNLNDGGIVKNTLNEIYLTFNQDISGEVNILEFPNIIIDSVKIIIEGNKIIISDVILNPGEEYVLNYNITSSSGKRLKNSIHFTVEDINPNPTILQAFYWEMNTGNYAYEHPEEENLWNLLSKRAPELSDAGITALWLPPANKAMHGINDVGYATYDLWDLGEFDQKGTVRTKYGTKEELEQAVNVLHQHNIKVYYDAVLNHRMGADATEIVTLNAKSPDKSGEEIEAWTVYDFPGRVDKYSSYKWNWQSFDGTDWDQRTGLQGKYLFKGKSWDYTYNYNDDYLMGADVDYQNSFVKEDVIAWGKWIVNDIDFDGFRLDAIKHIDQNFINQWINEIQNNSGKDIFFVGEAWIEDKNQLSEFIDRVGNPHLKVFDFPLRNTFVDMIDGADMSKLNDAGLVNKPGYEDKAVMFIDNHDTDRDKDGYTIPIYRRKYQAYAYILTRAEGIPTVFWKDYYIWGMKEGLDRLLKARKYFAYGPGFEVNNNDHNVYSYVRSGFPEVEGDGLVLMISDGTSGEIISKKINSRQPNTEFYDFTGNITQHVITDKNGYGNFMVKACENEGWSIWVPVN